MKTKIMIFLAVLVSSVNLFSADYFWVDGTGNWSDLTHWATTSGGAVKHIELPDTTDNVFFDANSFTADMQTVTFDSKALCNNMDWSQITKWTYLAQNATDTLFIYGNLTLNKILLGSNLKKLAFISNEKTNTHKMKSTTIGGIIYIIGSLNGVAKFDSLQASQLIHISGILNFDSTTVSLNGYNAYGTAYPGVLLMRGTQLSVRGYNKLANNVTVHAENSYISMTWGTRFRDYTGTVYNVLSIEMANGLMLEGNPVFDTIIIKPGCLINPYNAVGSNYYTANKFIMDGTPQKPIKIECYYPAEYGEFRQTTGTVDGKYLELKNMHAVGGATFNAINSVDNGNNTGWIFDTICPTNIVDLFCWDTILRCKGMKPDITSTNINGKLPVSYLWSTGSTSENIDDVPAGKYYLSVTEGFGCKETDSITLTEPETEVGIKVLEYIPASDKDSSDGQIAIEGTGGWGGPYSYWWEVIETEDSVGTKMAPGVYEVWVGDKKGCDVASYLAMYDKNSIPKPLVAAITVLDNDTICDGDSTVLLASNGNGYIYKWKMNDTLLAGKTSSKLIVKTAGHYQVEIMDMTGSVSISDSIAITVNPAVTGIDFSATPVTLVSAPFNVAFSNSTPSASNYNFSWKFGDGNLSALLSANHTYGYNGTYSVSLTATDKITGCKNSLTKSNYISCSGGANCNLSGTIAFTGSSVICENDSLKLAATDNNVTARQWFKNGVLIAGAIDSLYTVKEKGEYTVMLTSAMCSRTSQSVSVMEYPFVKPLIVSDKPLLKCIADTISLYTHVAYASYIWSTGKTTPVINSFAPGKIAVKAKDIYGCSFVSDSLAVIEETIPAPNICLATVDSTSTFNKIIWEPSVYTVVDHYNIYKLMGSNYDSIGTIKTGLTVYNDLLSNPKAKAERYKISVVDVCGNKSALSPYHETMNLSRIKGITATDVTLLWNKYVDESGAFTPEYYYIYRGTDPKKLVKSDSISGSIGSNPINFNITDAKANEYYLVTLNKDVCDPAGLLKAEAGPYTQSLSNIAEYNAGIDLNTDAIVMASVYPNPAVNNVTVTYAVSGLSDVEISLCNALGTVVSIQQYSSETPGIRHHEIALDNLAAGIYNIKIMSGSSMQILKVIKQ